MTFSDRLLEWFDKHGRHDLPWQHPRTPYRVWLSEVMLQQTQVATVIGYFARFLERFPDLPTLAEAPLDDVLARWAGLGYYSRARNLHRAAQVCVANFGGTLPDSLEALVTLPGVGRSTAAAILSQAFDRPATILDGNVKRVLARYSGNTTPINERSMEQRLWALADSLLPEHRAADYSQAMMDLGATVCTPRKPVCTMCPLEQDCVARSKGLQESIPVRAPKRAVPVREIQMLLLRDQDGALLLQRRPEQGIWGGLYSLPEFPIGADLISAARTSLGLDIELGERMHSLDHRFTHFLLQITAREARVAARNRLSEPLPGHQFVHGAALTRLGLPKPVAMLLESLNHSEVP
ncbi:MAG: A/G-specific adenine glycosylase [Ahniella sp.]|nr:A/G-specific adenine glycosylase [Ahniella sp.]